MKLSPIFVADFIIWAVITSVLYLTFSFIFATFNFVEWGSFGRAWFILLDFMLMYPYASSAKKVWSKTTNNGGDENEKK